MDYLLSDNSNSLPDNINRINSPGFKELCFDFLKDQKNIYEYIPKFIEKNPKYIIKDVHFEVFDYDLCYFSEEKPIKKDRNVILFDYSSKNKITGHFKYFKLPIKL